MQYRQRLGRDIDRWIRAGWIDAAYRDSILGDIGPGPSRPSALGVLTILGAALLGLSALTFVGANWDAIPRLARFALLLACLWASLLGGAQAFRSGHAALGHALSLLGVVLFGAAIMLTAQTFNMTSFRNTAVLIWAAAGGLTAWLTGSRPVLILATGLGALWAGLEAANPYVTGSIWGYWPVAAAGALMAIRLRSNVSMHLTTIAVALWIAHALYLWERAHPMSDPAVQAIAILTFGALALAASVLRDRAIPGSGVVAGWMTVITLVAAFLIQFPLDGGRPGSEAPASAAYLGLALPALAVILALTGWRIMRGRLTRWEGGILIAAGLAIAALPLILADLSPAPILLRMAIGALLYAAFTALILIGDRHGRGLLRVCGVTGFVLQTLYVYAETFEGLLDTALFFFVGGLILFGASFVIWQIRKHRPVQPDHGEVAS
jgi:uncharacterized membrane protein